MAIYLKDIKKQYKGSSKPVIEHLDLTIEEGSFTVLLGPSGCGKTTALRMIAGLEDVTGGHIFIDDTDVTDVDPAARNIAMVFQNYAIYPHMTVRGNIEFGLKNYKIDKEEIKLRTDQVLATCGLTDFADRKPNQLSGGQRQRVALARAISKSPKAFLMDEPLSNLDAKLRNQMRSEMIQLYHMLKTTFVYVTHDQTEAMTMGTDIVVIYKGKIMQHASPKEIYNNPANLFVAQFIGDPGMNAFELSGGGFVGFKPREATIAAEKLEGNFNLEATVLTCEFLGYDNLITCDSGIGHVVVRAPEAKEPDEKVIISVDPSKLFYFDKEQNRTDEVQTGELVRVYHVDE